jgi:thiopurine S-methyltransferase
MDETFWLQKWRDAEIGFHQNDANRLLTEHFGALSLPEGSRIFVPLCGKTLDMRWLLAEGYRVVGIDLAETAVEQFFDELGAQPRLTDEGTVRRYRTEQITLFAGDVFALSEERLGPVDAVYDRAALVALPEKRRVEYTAHLMAITACAPQLLLTFRYEPDCMEGPPFSIDEEEVHRHYGAAYDVQRAASVEVPGGLKGTCPAREEAWMLRHGGRPGQEDPGAKGAGRNADRNSRRP